MSAVRKWVKKSVVALNVVAVVGILLSYAAARINPNQFWPIAYFGLGYPIFLLLNIGFLLFWMFQRKWQALISIATIVLGWSHFTSFVQFRISSGHLDQGVKVMSYNVHNFDLYGKDSEHTRNRIFKLLEDEEPDVVCFQEFYTDKKDLQNLEKLKLDLGYSHAFVDPEGYSQNGRYWGIATLSKFPILNADRIDFPGVKQNACIYVDIDMNGDLRRIFNLHLQSIYFNQSDYEDIDKAKKNKLSSKGSKRIAIKLRDAFKKRAKQVDIAKAAIEKSPFPVIVCGDFNDTPVSYTYRTMVGDLEDAYKGNGIGFGSTYAKNIPFLRIDYLLHDPTVNLLGYRAIKQSLSDHYPIVASFD